MKMMMTELQYIENITNSLLKFYIIFTINKIH